MRLAELAPARVARWRDRMGPISVSASRPLPRRGAPFSSIRRGNLEELMAYGELTRGDVSWLRAAWGGGGEGGQMACLVGARDLGVHALTCKQLRCCRAEDRALLCSPRRVLVPHHVSHAGPWGAGGGAPALLAREAPQHRSWRPALTQPERFP